MEKSKENEEILKENIFSVYSNSLNEMNRQQVFFGQLCGLIYNWCRDYFKINVTEVDSANNKTQKVFDMGVEVAEITKRLLKDKSKANIPQDKEGFIKYLVTSLKMGKYEYIRNYEKRNENDIIRMKESHLGRKLTEDEKLFSIEKWYDYENVKEIKSAFLKSANYNENPQIDYLNSEKTSIILEAINSVLAKKQKRSRDCYRALLTLHCIDNEDLYSVLDSQIIEKCKNYSENPKQYEIYQKYHPEASKGSSEAIASKNLKEILSDLEMYLKEKNPEIFQ